MSMRGIAVCCAVVLLMSELVGCGLSEPTVQVRNLKYIQMLRTAVSSRDPAKVDKVMDAVQLQKSQGAVSDDEMAVVMEIALLAKGDDWAKAEQACFQLEQGQQWRRR